MRNYLSLSIFIVLFSIFGIHVASAHDTAIFSNTLEIHNGEVVFISDGFIAQLTDYQNEVRNNIIIRNNGKLCNFGEFTNTWDEDPQNGFKVNVFCQDVITNLSVEDRIIAESSSPTNKIYTVNRGDDVETKQI